MIKKRQIIDMIKKRQIKYSDAMNKQNEFLKNLNEVKMGKKTIRKKEVINNLEKIYKSREEVINLFRDYIEMLSDANYDARKNETEGKGLKILTPKQMLQRLPIALAQVKVGNNSENLLNEIRKVVILCINPNK